MKKVIRITFVLVLAAASLNAVEAQRGGNRGSADGNRRGSTVLPQRNNSRGDSYRNPGAQMGSVRRNSVNNVNRAATNRREDGRANAINNNRIISTNQRRTQAAVIESRGNRGAFGTAPGVYRQNRVGNQRVVSRNYYPRANNYNSSRYNNYSNRNNYYNRGRNYPRFFSYGPRYSVLPRSFITINFGGYPYHYNNGLFYGSYGGYYQSLFPPPGISIAVLPFGYSRVFVGDDPFYYYNGIYYRQYPDRDNYEVVDAPMGATVSSLPKGAKSVVLNGEKLYELNGTYYKEDRDSKGATVYTVVGKDGEINNSDNDSDNSGNLLPPASLNNGDVIGGLPEGSKTVIINGEKLYVTPDDTYLKEESDGNIVQYKVVGK